MFYSERRRSHGDGYERSRDGLLGVALPGGPFPFRSDIRRVHGMACRHRGKPIGHRRVVHGGQGAVASGAMGPARPCRRCRAGPCRSGSRAIGRPSRGRGRYLSRRGGMLRCLRVVELASSNRMRPQYGKGCPKVYVRCCTMMFRSRAISMGSRGAMPGADTGNGARSKARVQKSVLMAAPPSLAASRP